MDMNATKICPGCQRPLVVGAPDGLCPQCLMKAGLGTGVDVGPDSQGEDGRTPFVAPSLKEVARLFPQVEILDFIGQGGMGAVYKARQKDLDRVVALKILPPGIGQDPAFAERFTREAKALAKLNHPGVVTLYEFGKADGLFFFMMEFVDGVSLRQLLDGDRISPREALAIVPQICDALQYAHDQGIVHRDIKPENILLDRQGRVKVADFGLAKLVGADAGGVPLTPSLSSEGGEGGGSLTEAGKVMGTPQYMAPEQREHPTEVDHRADIYSLGVVFYQMLTGELPVRPITPPSRKVQVDVRLDEVVLRALEKDPQRRYQQVSQVKTDVQTITGAASALGAEVRPASPPSALGWRDRWLWDSRNWMARGYLIFLALALLLMPVWISIWGPLAFCVLALVPPAAVYAWVGQGIKKLKANLPPSDAEVAEAWIAWEEGLWPFNRSQGLAVLHADRLELVPLWYGTPITVVLNDIISVREVDQVYVRLVWKRGFVLVLENGDRVSIAIPEPFARRWRTRLSGGTALEKEAERRYQQVSEAKAMVDSISGSSSPVMATAPSPARPAATRGRLRAALVVGVLVWLFVTGTVTLITWIRPDSWKVVAVISCPHSQSGRPINDHFKFIATMIELIRSDVILGRVIDRLQLDERSGKLDERWGKHSLGLKLTKAQAMVLLKRRLDVRSEGGTLIQVGVFGKRPEEPEEAMDIANTISEELHAFRIEQHESPADMLEMTFRFTPPKLLLGLAAGFVLGLLAGGLVLWRGFLRRGPQASQVRMAVETSAQSPPVAGGGRQAVDWRTWAPLQSHQEREICMHLAEAEKREGTIRAALFGVWVAATCFGPFFCIEFMSKPVGWFVAVAAFVVGLAGILVLRRMQREFLCSTGWARQQGLTPEQLRNRAAFGGDKSALAAVLQTPARPRPVRRWILAAAGTVLLVAVVLIVRLGREANHARHQRLAAEQILGDVTESRIEEVRAMGQKAIIRAWLDDLHELRLFVGNESLGWSIPRSYGERSGQTRANGTRSSDTPVVSPGFTFTVATVELSEQIRLADGSMARGLIFETGWVHHYIAATPEGDLPNEEVVFRPNSEITDEKGTFTFADIHQTDGVRIPISICVRPVAGKPPDMGGFGPAIDRVITTFDADDQGFVFFDLETGTSFKPPFSLTFQRIQGPAFVEVTSELKQWIEVHDVDLLLHLGERNWDWMTLGMRESLETKHFEWETSLPEAVIAVFADNDPDQLVRNETPDARFGHSYQFRFSQLKGFQTRKNTTGLYQFRGLENTTTRGVRLRYKTVREAGETAQSAGGDPRSRTFTLRHTLASEMADDLRQILLGRFGMEARPAPDNMQLTVTAPPDVLNRVSTFITVADWPERIARGADYYYPRDNVELAVRSFFYACSIEDTNGVALMLSPGLLAELKGTTLTAHGVLGEANDEELVRQLRGDWPGKGTAVQEVIQAWNRFPLQRLWAEPGVAIGFGLRYFATAWFEGAPEERTELSFIPDRTGGTNGPLLIDTLPPWLEQMESGLEASKLSPDEPPAAGCEASKIVGSEDIPTERGT